MPWYSKEQPTPFDTADIPGLEFLHGDVLAKRYRQSWIEGKKYPLITFPSGIQRELSSSDEHPNGAVHVFDGFAADYESGWEANREDALELGRQGYLVSAEAANIIRIKNPYSRRSYRLTFDANTGHLANIVLYPEHAMELLGGESRALLPPLYVNEKIGLEAVAPLKFFAPDSNWTWYPTEFDGNDIFFGLVSGFEVELGYFALSELEGLRGALGLPIERDLYFEPTRLKDLIALHQSNRR